MFNTNNPVANEIYEVVESSTRAEQKRMLYLLKVEKTRTLARKLQKGKPAEKFSDEMITDIIHAARKAYGRK